MITYVNNSVNYCKYIDCQGLIMWSLAGQQYPQPCSSWIGDPRILSTIAPEMDEIADEVLKLITDAGLRSACSSRSLLPTLGHGHLWPAARPLLDTIGHSLHAEDWP